MASDAEVPIKWEPWVAAPMLLGSTGHGHILAALRRLLPVNMLSRDSLEAFDDSAGVSIICFAFDSASGNIATYSYLAYLLERSIAATVFFHGQRCLTHHLHIIRSASVTLSAAAGVLYSLSKLMQHSNSTLALHAGIVSHVRDNLQIREGAAPENSDFLRVVLGMFGVDGDWSLLVSAGEKRKVTPFSARLADLCQHCRCDLKSKTWLYYIGVAPARSIDPEVATQSISKHLVSVFLGARWEVAALSRWTGISQVLKRVVLGSMCNHILPDCLALLSRHMGVSDGRIEIERRKIAEAVGLGKEEVDSS